MLTPTSIRRLLYNNIAILVLGNEGYKALDHTNEYNDSDNSGIES